MVFKGFNISYPSYTVITPQTGDQYSVRCLTVSELNELRHSQLTSTKAATVINDMVWKAITEKPEHVTNFKSFLNSTSLLDRVSIVYAVYNSTFGNEKEFQVTCNNCNHQQKIKFNLNDIFKITPYPYSEKFVQSYKIAKAAEGQDDPYMEAVIAERDARGDKIVDVSEKKPDDKKDMNDVSKDQISEILKDSGVQFVDDDEKPDDTPNEEKEVKKTNSEPEFGDVYSILNRKIEVELPVSKIMAIIKQPTLLDESTALADAPYSNMKAINIIADTLIIDRLYQHLPDGSINEARYRDEVIVGYKSLPLDDKAKIFEVYYDNFGKYGVELKSQWTCASCSHQNELELDIIDQFFRVVSTL